MDILTRRIFSKSRYRSGPVRKIRRRAVLKNGECNVLQSRISRRSLRFLQDIFTTLVDTQWRWTLLCFTLSFVLSWLGFAVIWWLIAFTHGDFDEKHLPHIQAENNWTPCVYNIFSFTSCFLFSIETQHTIGYGSRSTSEECPEAIFIMCIQSIAGVMIQAFMVGIVFAKMSRPKQRTQTLLFSRNAVVCQRDGELCFMFRVADMRKSHIIGATVRAQVIKTKTTKEGEILGQNQQELAIGTDGNNGNIFFIWPITIIHKINGDSPFYNMSAEDMLTERFEVVVILEGTIESTGQTTQARSSYLPHEILWGHRFESMVCYSKERQGYEVDHSLFNTTTQVDTPLCSARELTDFYRIQDDLRHGTGLIIDDEVMCTEPYHDIHYYMNHHRLAMIGPNHNFIARAESIKSNNSVEEHGVFNKSVHRDPQNRIPSPHFIHHPQRDTLGHEQKSIETDNDSIQIIGEMDFQHFPEAVNREIVKNNGEIIFEEEQRESEALLSQEDNSSSIRPIVGKRSTSARFPILLDEEKRLINDSRRNLNSKNFNIIDDEKRSLNGSRRNLNGSKRYILVSVEKAEGWNGSAKNLNIGSKENLISGRRHTGSRERLNVMKHCNKKGTKEHHSIKIKRKLIDIMPSECHRPTHIAIEIEKQPINDHSETTRPCDNNLTPLITDFTTLPSGIITTTPPSECTLTPESGYAEGQFSNSSPEPSKRQIEILNDTNEVSRNRRSYEHAQLHDVNDILMRSSSGSSCADSDGVSKDIVAENCSKQKKFSPKPVRRQTISHTSV